MRFAQKTANVNKTTNFEGDLAYQLTPQMQLYSAVCTSILSDKFYTKNDVSTGRIRILVGQVPGHFVEQLAIFAREKMYLRTIPLVLCVELARIGKLHAETVQRVIQRPDEIYELLGYYCLANERSGANKKLNKLSKAIETGIRLVFESGKFDEYQYAKYNRKVDPSLRDALFLTHPKAKDIATSGLFARIAEDKLEIPYTWETQLSEKGNTQEVWQELIDSKKVGYMATLRNLRNILQAKVSNSHLEKVCSYLSNPEAVKNSRQLPFRFLSAYRELKNTPEKNTSFVLENLEQAVKHSVNNIAGFDIDTDVLIACDVSGSMQKPVSPRSAVQNYDIGLILGMILQSKCQSVITGMFGDTWKPIQLPKNQILANTLEYHRREGEVGYSTNGYLILEWLILEKKKMDKIFIFTDNQMWNSRSNDIGKIVKLFEDYKKISPEAKIYLFDLSGYGTTPLDTSRKDVFIISGWSDKIFDCLEALESGKNVLETFGI